MSEFDEKASRVFFITVKTPLQAGGGTGTDRADNAIQREAGSQFPKVVGTTWKGAVLDRIPEVLRNHIRNEGMNGDRVKLSFSDLRILLFPIKSPSNLYSLVTCPTIVNWFMEEMIWLGFLNPDSIKMLKVRMNNMKNMNEKAAYQFTDKTEAGYEIIGNVPYKITPLPLMKNPFYLLGMDIQIVQKIRILPDCDFSHLTRAETELVTRNPLKESTQIQKRKLFTEEYLTEETVLYGFITELLDLIKPVKTSTIEKILCEIGAVDYNHSAQFQMGKNSSLGKGMISLKEARPFADRECTGM